MGRKRTKGKRQVNLELPEEVAESLDRFAKDRGESKGEVTAQALRRHIANPPPRPVPPPDPDLPPLPPVQTPKKGKPRP